MGLPYALLDHSQERLDSDITQILQSLQKLFAYHANRECMKVKVECGRPRLAMCEFQRRCLLVSGS